MTKAASLSERNPHAVKSGGLAAQAMAAISAKAPVH
jgi:hypothetical protein